MKIRAIPLKLRLEWVTPAARGGLGTATRLITSSNQLSTVFRKQLDLCATVHLAVAWASIHFPGYDALVKAEQKIGRAVIGIHFYQTAPEFIKRFCRNEHVRFIKNPSGVFHPKLYVFDCKGGDWACIVGSSNFTRGGFEQNDEASFLVTAADDPSGAILSKAHSLIKHYWDHAEPGMKIDLTGYREAKRRYASALAHVAGQFGSGRSGRLIEEIDVLKMSWREFLERVRGDKSHDIGERLEVLKAARGLFLQYGAFAAMPTKDRQGIAGFRKEDGVPWGWFGSMRGAGVFKKLVNESPEAMSNALDQVPLCG